MVGDGRLRVREVFERRPGDWWRAIVDIEGDRQVDSRLIDLTDDTDNPRPFDSTRLGFRTGIVGASGADVEAVRLRRKDTGFYQYSIRAADDGSEPGSFVRRTFLRSQHDHAAFTPDGDTMFYFTRDPISGYRQLFRLRIDQLPEGP